MANPQVENGYVRIANDIIDRLLELDLSGQEFKIAMLVIRKTYGFQKIKDMISLSQMMKATRMNKTRCSQIMGRLQFRKIITVTKNCNGIGKEYRFNKNYEEWREYSQKDNRYKKMKSTVTLLRNQPLQKSVTTKDILTKDTSTKDTLLKTGDEAAPDFNADSQPKDSSQFTVHSSQQEQEKESSEFGVQSSQKGLKPPEEQEKDNSPQQKEEPTLDEKKKIAALCEQLMGVDGFQPFVFVQKTIKLKIRHAVTIRVLESCVKRRQDIPRLGPVKSWWAYAVEVMGREADAQDEADRLAEHMRMKSIDLAEAFQKVRFVPDMPDSPVGRC